MTNKKNRHKHQHQQPSRYQEPPKIQINEEELLKQCLQMHELLKNRTAKLRELETGDMCYILSTRWLKEWKQYVGYEAATEEGQKIDKRFYGRKHPSKINLDITAPLHESKSLYQLPEQMKQYDYFGTAIGQKKQKDDDYIAVTKDIWSGFLEYYQGDEIRRPVRKMKGSFYYDSYLMRCDTIFVNLQDEELSDRIKKTPKKLYDSIFPSDKMQFSSLWNYKDLQKFLKIYCKYTYGHDNIRIWKVYSYLATNPAAIAMVEAIKDKKYLVKGRLITQDQFTDLDLDQYIKTTHTLVVQIGEALISEVDDSPLRGYCEYCVEKKSLQISCVCHQVDYCSWRCRVDDQSFHFKSCCQAFQSDDDEQYQLKYSNQIPKCGLENLGNTCYMNSVLQTLFSIEHFRQFFSSNEYLKHLNQKQLKDNNCVMLRKYSKTIKNLIEEEKCYTPWSLKGQIDYNMGPFRGYNQHDANDFLVNFLNVMNDYLSKVGDKAYNEILQSFIGQFHSKVICPHCNIQSQNNQIFMQVSVPIKSKTKNQAYSYCVVNSPANLLKGRANLCDTWAEMKKNLKVPLDTLVFALKQPEGLVLIDQSECPPDKAIKKTKSELIYYKGLNKIQGQYFMMATLVTTKILSGYKIKSPYGVPCMLSINDVEVTLGTFWLRIIQTVFVHKPQVIAQAQKMEKQYFMQIQEAVRAQFQEKKNQKNTQAQTKVPKQGEEEEQQSQACKKIVQHFNQSLKVFIQKIGIEVYINHFKKHKGTCAFCSKKCQNCDLPIIFDKGFQDFFSERYSEVKFQVHLHQQLQIQTTQNDISSTGDPSIQDCLTLFNQPQQLDQQNAWYCHNCDNMALALKQLDIKVFPPILILHLNRFKNYQGKKIKNSEPITYNQYQTFGSCKYRLLSVVVHQGSMDAGHYWSICLRGDSYFIFNDAKVITTEKVFQKNAYLLVYGSLDFTP